MTEDNEIDIIGRAHPMWLEKAGVLALVVAAILIGRRMWLDEWLPEALMWPVSICMLPLAVVLLAEAWGRLLQKR